MICSNCGKSAAENARFCLHCGAPLNAPLDPLTCGRCGALSDGAGAFCSRCGFPLAGDSEQVPDSSTKRGPHRVSFMVPAAILVVILCSVFFWHAGTPASGSGTQDRAWPMPGAALRTRRSQ